MEAVLMHGSVDQRISPYKSHIGKVPKNIHRRPFFSMPSENCLPPHFHAMAGLLQPPPPYLSHSYPPYSFQQPPQPPLLPLPTATPRRTSVATRVLSFPPPNKKANNYRTRDSSLTPKNSKPKSPKKNEKISLKKSSSTNPVGPDPKELPKDVAKVLPFNISSGNLCSNNANNNGINNTKAVEDHQLVDMFSGSAAFAISPPPSSLPLPTFSLKPKLSCKAEAAGIDTGATDDLRRLLRLR